MKEKELTPVEYAHYILKPYQHDTDNFSIDLHTMSTETLMYISPVSREALQALAWLMNFAHPKEIPNMRRAYAYLSALRDLQAAAYTETLEKWRNETIRIENWLKSRS